eukprot:TRINITY_DN9468_c0_g1_i1.p1 TRINITY_DN9468_c0_g1~~TRINITY_DN9468_c0_g1_i1.p1  ORF type:complete len:245 (+),score=33.11 TRINITY_DN9468_c0_g1_i1:110-844(+)
MSFTPRLPKPDFPDFRYLLPPRDLLNKIKHHPSNVKKGSREKATRQLFYTPIDEFERERLNILKSNLQSHRIQIPADFPDEEMLKFLYATRFDVARCVRMLRLHFEWMGDPELHRLTGTTMRLVEDGVIYQHGRDFELRPVLVIDLEKVTRRPESAEEVNQALSFVLNLIKYHMFVAGFIESAIILINAASKSPNDIPLEFISQVIRHCLAHYPCFMYRLFIVNPSRGLYIACLLYTSPSPRDS